MIAFTCAEGFVNAFSISSSGEKVSASCKDDVEKPSLVVLADFVADSKNRTICLNLAT